MKNILIILNDPGIYGYRVLVAGPLVYIHFMNPMSVFCGRRP